MSRYEDLTRRFLAAGDVEHSNGTLDLFYEKDNELILKPWTGKEFGETEFVTDQVREKTPVAALILPSEPDQPVYRMLFCISQSHLLECYAYHPGEERWKEIKLGPVGDAIVHHKSNLGAILTPEGLIVLYQAPDNTLRGIINNGTSWEPLGQPLSARALPGTPISITSSGGNPTVFYVNEDNGLHYQSIQSEGNDNALENSRLTSPVTRIKVVQNEETKQVATYVLTEDDHIYLLDQDGNAPTDVGYIENEQFEATKSAQAVLVNWWFPPPVPVWQDWVPVTNWVPRTWIGW
ncbi:hypothetical protein UA08_03758 [Talaromyces atroroseus]|uniref:Fucose-specific lectin n=1 Tax=Talaromyces atroroseus TaxID=1441469 RepID=A0A225AYP2_TALAT|nr:hypothetical protein UA08_03758 [Talaromyces atroroseus]OKL60829.1 hypothetical protein UA08_03758 [Talaromyces atroroseus]